MSLQGYFIEKITNLGLNPSKKSVIHWIWVGNTAHLIPSHTPEKSYVLVVIVLCYENGCFHLAGHVLFLSSMCLD